MDATEDGPISHTNTSNPLEELTPMLPTHTLAKMDLAHTTHPTSDQESADGATSEEETKQPCLHISNPLDQSPSVLMQHHGNTTKEESSPLADNQLITASNLLDTPLTFKDNKLGSSETPGELHGDTVDTSMFSTDKTCAQSTKFQLL